MAGMHVVPQVQYTRSQIDNIDVVQGSQAGFAAAGGASERGRLGVAIDRSFATAGGITWTPYGALSAVREFDGESTFVVADAFEGGTDIEGTSSLVELGVGAQKGGFSATAGVNWTDGGALDSFVGGQLVLRYTW
jgi:outer membrane autotransporter protein